MSVTMKVKRGTRAQIDAAAGSSELQQGELYLITDEDRIAVGTGAATYETYAKTGEAGGQNVTVATAAYTASSGDYVLADTTGGTFAVTLPASPTQGDRVTIVDSADSWATSNLTVARNGATLEGLSEDLVCNIGELALVFDYTGTTWSITVLGPSLITGSAVTVTGNQALTGKTLHGDTNTLTVDGTEAVGFKRIPVSGAEKTSGYTLATSDIGKMVVIGTGGGVTVPDATFAAGDVVSIFNNTAADATITGSITTMFLAGEDADKATLTLATRGLAVVTFISATVAVVSGNVS